MILLGTIVLALVALLLNPSVLGFSAALAFVCLIALGRKEREAINPYYLFALTPFSLLLYSDSVSSVFLPKIALEAQLNIMLAIYSYLGGLMTIRWKGCDVQRSSTKAYSFTVVLMIGLAPHFLGLMAAGIPILASDVNAAKESYVLPIIGQFSIFLPITMLIAFHRQNRTLILVSVTLSAFFSIISASKFYILFNALFFISAYIKYGGRDIFVIRPIYFLIAAVAAVPFLFEAVFAARDATNQLDFFWRQEVVFQSQFLDQVGDYTYLPYLYLTTPWSNFSYVVELEPEFSFGSRTVFSLASVFQLDDLLNISPRPIRMPQFNTHAYLTDFYLDFGLAGVILLSYLLGVLVKWSYLKALKQTDVMSDGIWISIGFASFLLFFSNHFTGQSYPVLSVLVFGAYRLISRSLKRRRR